MSLNDYINSFLTEKFSQFSLSSSQKFEGLFLSLRESRQCSSYSVPSKNCGTELYIPCVFALVSGKNENIYCELLHQLIMLMEYILMPRTITTGFETA
ncbi:hypothetical protein HZS_421 [Henneguya salminicola]|nr:hypothetical protein HZS_421 [Henneguya salminicola]